MASTYNSRALVAEVMVEGDRFAIVADRIAPQERLTSQHLSLWMEESVAAQRSFAPQKGCVK